MPKVGKADFHELPQVAYDETPIGNYLELEGPEKWIDEVATRLGYSRQDYITSSYLALYFQKCREEGKKPGNMVFKGRNRLRVSDVRGAFPSVWAPCHLRPALRERYRSDCAAQIVIGFRCRLSYNS